MKKLITIEDIPVKFKCVINKQILYESAKVNGNDKQHYEYNVINKWQLSGKNDPFTGQEIREVTKEEDHQEKLCTYLKNKGVKIHGSLKEYMKQQVEKVNKDIPIEKNQTLLDVRTPEGKYLIEYAAENHSIKWIESYLKIYKNNQHDKESFQEKLQCALYAAIMSVEPNEPKQKSTNLYKIVELLTQKIDSEYKCFCLHCDTSDIILKLVFKIPVITCLHDNPALLKNMRNFLKAVRKMTFIRLKGLLQQKNIYSDNYYLRNSINYCISYMILSKLLVSSKSNNNLTTWLSILQDWNNLKEKLSNIEEDYEVCGAVINFFIDEYKFSKMPHIMKLLVKAVEWAAAKMNSHGCELFNDGKFKEALKKCDECIEITFGYVNKLIGAIKEYKLKVDLTKIYQRLIIAIVNKAIAINYQGHELFNDGKFKEALNKCGESIKITQDWINKLTTEMKEYKLTLDLTRIYRKLITAVANKADVLNRQTIKLLKDNNLQEALNECGESIRITQDCIDKLPKKYKLTLDLTEIYRELITAVANEADVLNRQTIKLLKDNNLQGALNKCDQRIKIAQDWINKLTKKIKEYKLTLDLTEIYQKLITAVVDKAKILNFQAVKLLNNNNFQGVLNKCDQRIKIAQDWINKLTKKIKEYKLTLDLTVIYQQLMFAVARKAYLINCQVIELEKTNKLKEAENKITESIEFVKRYVNVLKIKNASFLEKTYQVLVEFKNIISNKKYSITNNIVEKLKQHKDALQSYLNIYPKRFVSKLIEPRIIFTLDCVNNCIKTLLFDNDKLIKLHNNKLDIVKKNYLAIQNILPYVAKLKNINFTNKKVISKITQLKSYIMISQKQFNKITEITIKKNNTNISQLKQIVAQFKEYDNDIKNDLICCVKQVVFDLNPQSSYPIIKILMDILSNEEILSYLTATNQKIPFKNTQQIDMLCQRIFLQIDALSYENLNIILGLVSIVGSIQTFNGISENMMMLDRKKPKPKSELKLKLKSESKKNFPNFFKEKNKFEKKRKCGKKRKLGGITNPDNSPESQKKKRKLNK
jgi:hypothetical protein